MHVQSNSGRSQGRTTAVDWINIFNRLFELINVQGTENYFSGPRFIQAVRRIDPYHADYNQVRITRQALGKSTTRKDYYFDILMSFPESERIRLVNEILDQLDSSATEHAAHIRAVFSGGVAGPSASVPSHGWNADRLNQYLRDIDASIAAGNEERAVTLSYTCLEGFYKAFVSLRLPEKRRITDLIALSRAIKEYLRENHGPYPDEVLNMVTHVSHAVDRARNQFSESHFDREAEHWLAVYVRDLVNTQIRLLLHFL